MARPALLFAVALAILPSAAGAQAMVIALEEQVAEATVAAAGAEADAPPAPDPGGSERFVATVPQALPEGLAYGPFRVLDKGRAALVGVTDANSPAAFAAMLAAHPGIATLELVECPGTFDDRANLKLGRMIRARGLATHVPDGGSVRSGAVELFLAGTRRKAEARAEFAVHAWEDEDGRQATDYPETAPENRTYLDYYREMGMSAEEARDFYAMTNSVPFEQARWLDAAEMARWVRYN